MLCNMFCDVKQQQQQQQQQQQTQLEHHYISLHYTTDTCVQNEHLYQHVQPVCQVTSRSMAATCRQPTPEGLLDGVDYVAWRV